MTCKILCCINCTVFRGFRNGPYCFRCADANRGERANDIDDTEQPCDGTDGETPYSLQFVCRHGRHRSPVISQSLTDIHTADDEPDDDDAEDSPEDQEEDYPGPPKCRCRCGCQNKPEGRIQCRWCNRFVGPECCASTTHPDSCHVCVDEWYRESQATSESRLCKLCMTNPRTVQFQCGHQVA